MARKNAAKSKGTAMAEKTRARSNKLSDPERERLLGKVLERIHKARPAQRVYS